jgi:hypothetical protein
MQVPACVTSHVVLMSDASSVSPHVTNINNSSTLLNIEWDTSFVVFFCDIKPVYKVDVDCDTRELTETNNANKLHFLWSLKAHVSF